MTVAMPVTVVMMTVAVFMIMSVASNSHLVTTQSASTFLAHINESLFWLLTTQTVWCRAWPTTIRARASGSRSDSLTSD